MKIYLIKSRWVEDGVETKHPDCFIKAESARGADRVFRKGFYQDKVRYLQVLSVEELTWEMFQQIAPDEFMLCDQLSF